MFLVSLDFFQQIDEVGMILTHGFYALTEVEHLVNENVLEIRVESLLKLSKKHLKAGKIAGFCS